MKVLIVDDIKANRMLVAEILHDHECDEAEDGNQALSLTRTKKYDLILLDLSMPNCDGNQFLEEFKKYDTETCVLVVTAHIELAKESMYLRANGMILKPIDVDRLLDYVKEIDGG